MSTSARGRIPRRTFSGSKLRELRECRGWTQFALSEAIKIVDRSTISKWENGRGTPAETHVERLAQIFGISAEDFYDIPAQRTTSASIFNGSKETFESSLKIVKNSSHYALVFQTGGPKAPDWWRDEFKKHLREKEGAIGYSVVLCVDPEEIKRNTGLIKKIDDARNAWIPDMSNLFILEQRPQLAIDILIVDRRYVSFGLHAHNDSTRLSSIQFEDEGIAETLTTWLRNMHQNPAVMEYSEWKASKNLT